MLMRNLILIRANVIYLTGYKAGIRFLGYADVGNVIDSVNDVEIDQSTCHYEDGATKENGLLVIAFVSLKLLRAVVIEGGSSHVLTNAKKSRLIYILVPSLEMQIAADSCDYEYWVREKNICSK